MFSSQPIQCALDLNTTGIRLLQKGERKRALLSFRRGLERIKRFTGRPTTGSCTFHEGPTEPMIMGIDIDGGMKCKPTSKDECFTPFLRALHMNGRWRDETSSYRYIMVLTAVLSFNVGLRFHTSGSNDSRTLQLALDAYRMSYACFNRACRVTKTESPFRFGLVACCNNLGHVYERAGFVEPARLCYKQLAHHLPVHSVKKGLEKLDDYHIFYTSLCMYQQMLRNGAAAA